MKTTHLPKRRLMHGQAGFSLIEVTMALGIMAFCLVGLFGLIPLGLSSNQTSVEQTMAASVAARIVADLRSTPVSSGSASTATTSLGFVLSDSGGASSGNPQILYFTETGNPSGLIGAQPVTSGTRESRYRANVGLSQQNGVAVARILVTWPALADVTNTGWPKNYSGSFESVTALNRN